MITWIKQRLSLPKFTDDEETLRRANLLNTIMITCLFFLIVMFIFFLSGERVHPRVFWIEAFSLLGIAGLYYCLRRGKVTLVGTAALLFIFVTNTLLLASMGTIRTPAAAIYLSVILLAGRLFGGRGMLLAFVFSSLAVSGLILAENAGLLPLPDYTVGFSQWLTYTALFAITGGLSFHANRNMRLALEKARMELARREQAEAELRQLTRMAEENKEMYRLLAENISDVIWILDVNTGRFRYVSPSVQRLRGYSVEEVLAQDMAAALTPESVQLLHEKLPLRIQAFKEGRHEIYVDEIAQPCKDGSYVWTETTTNFQINPASGQMEVYGVSRDITERRRTQASLQLRLELLEFAAHHSLDELMRVALDKIESSTGSAIGFYHFVEADQKNLSLQAWSTRTLQEFCKAEGKGQHYSLDMAGIWVDCVRQRRPVIHNDYASLPARKGMPPGHAEVIRELVVPVYRENQVVCILGVGNKSSDYTGKDVEIAAYLADVVWEIVERKRTEQNLSELQSRMGLLSSNLEDAGLFVFSRDAHGRRCFEYLSPGMETLSGVPIEDALRDADQLFRIVLPEYIPVLMDREAQSMQDLLSFEVEIRHRHALSGEVQWMLLRSTPRRRPDGSTVWYGVQVDISERKRSEQLLEEVNQQLLLRMREIEKLQDELREQSLRDPLTGLYNRRYLSATLVREVARTDRENNALSIIITDIDHFKRVNDTYGHQVGDRFLIAIAELIKRNARSSDIVCRYGGEEFLLVLPGTSLEAAVRRADEMRQKCAEFSLPHNGKPLRVTMSFGIATYPTHAQEPEKVIIQADQALYASKTAGRNRVTVWHADLAFTDYQ